MPNDLGSKLPSPIAYVRVYVVVMNSSNHCLKISNEPLQRHCQCHKETVLGGWTTQNETLGLYSKHLGQSATGALGRSLMMDAGPCARVCSSATHARSSHCAVAMFGVSCGNSVSVHLTELMFMTMMMMMMMMMKVCGRVIRRRTSDVHVRATST